MIEIVEVHPLAARIVAEENKDLIEKAAAASHDTFESLTLLAEEGRADFWIASTKDGVVGVMFSQIVQGAKDRRLRVLALGGKGGMRWLKQARKIVTDDARERGATKMTFIRIGGRQTYLGQRPAGYYYEDRL